MEQYYQPLTEIFLPYSPYLNYQFALPITMFQPSMELLLYSPPHHPQPYIGSINYEEFEEQNTFKTLWTEHNIKYSSMQTKKPLNNSKEENIIIAKSKVKEVYSDVTNRNILPNNLNLILSFIRRINKSGKFVERIIQKLKGDENFTTKKFYAYQSYLKQIIPFHKNRSTLKKLTEHIDFNSNIYTITQQKFYNKVCRILIDQFLTREYLTNILISCKIQRTSKNQHLKIRRYLISMLRANQAQADDQNSENKHQQ